MIMTRAKAVVTLALLFLLASAAGKPAFAAEYVDVETNDALAELAKSISSDGVLENVFMLITEDVTDLTPLSGLKHIKNGGLYVISTNLISLAPLKNLEVVDGFLDIIDNEALTAISLPALTEVGGKLYILSNGALTDFSLPALTEVDGNLYIIYNNALTDLSLPSLTEVGGQLDVNGNFKLASVFLKLDAVGEMTMFESWKSAQPFLTDFSVASLWGDFDVKVFVSDNEELAELAQQMISTEGVLENFTMVITDDVTDLTPLSGLKHIKNGGLSVWETTNLVSLAPLENLEIVDGNLWIYNIEALDVSLPSLTEVGGYLDISFNDALTAISLPWLTEIGGELRVIRNDVLESISMPMLDNRIMMGDERWKVLDNTMLISIDTGFMDTEVVYDGRNAPGRKLLF